jgi:NhaP-type Na+/H+ or K+/H+ antiporter
MKSSFQLVSVVLLLAAILRILNHRYVRLPRTHRPNARLVVTRLISEAIPSTLVHLRRLPKLRGIAVLTWGGLRGGISIALALTLEPSPYRRVLLAICYAGVVFTTLAQGLSMPMLVRRLYRPTAVPLQSP